MMYDIMYHGVFTFLLMALLTITGMIMYGLYVLGKRIKLPPIVRNIIKGLFIVLMDLVIFFIIVFMLGSLALLYQETFNFNYIIISYILSILTAILITILITLLDTVISDYHLKKINLKQNQGANNE